MVKIAYVSADGDEQMIDARNGQSLMEAAVKNGVEGIIGECGGVMACGTCRVYLDEAWKAHTGVPGELECEMLEFVGECRPDARLSCQIKATAELDGLVLHMPKSQH